MKVLITDDKVRQNRFAEGLRTHADVTFLHGGRWLEAGLNLSAFGIIFEHDTLSPNPEHSYTADQLSNTTLIGFGGDSHKRNKLLDPGIFKFKAEIEKPNQVNRVLEIINSDEVTLDDVMMILNIDPELERLLEPFAKAGPFANEPELQLAKASLIAYVNSKGADA